MFNADELIKEVGLRATRSIVITFDKRNIDEQRLLLKLGEFYELGLNENWRPGDVKQIILEKEL